jgi:hypothetical protein
MSLLYFIHCCPLLLTCGVSTEYPEWCVIFFSRNSREVEEIPEVEMSYTDKMHLHVSKVST